MRYIFEIFFSQAITKNCKPLGSSQSSKNTDNLGVIKISISEGVWIFFMTTIYWEKKHTYFTNWCNFQLWLLEVGEQRVKLDGRATREPFGGNALVISIYYIMRKLSTSWKYCSAMNLRFLPMGSLIFTFFYLLSHILVQVQNERFHHQGHSPSSSQKLFSLCSWRAIFQLQFLGNFSSGSEVGQKGLPVDSCTNIESSHATASNQCQTDFRQKADSSSESENFLEWHNQ